MTEQHPTPWRTVNMDEGNIEGWYEIEDANGQPVVDFVSESTGRRIAAAVNAREELLAALEATLPNLRWADTHGSRAYGLVDRLEALIARAKGQQEAQP